MRTRAPRRRSGTLVSSLVSLSGGVNNVTDVDGTVTGIALTGTGGTGTWLYSTNGGTNWNPVGAVTDTSALLLAANAGTRLYFLPADPDFNGTINNAITFRAWDQSTGTNGQSGVDVSVNGTTTAFSTATDTANITIADVPGFALVGTGDINGDGRDDLLWREEHGELLVWYNGTQNQAVSLGNLDPVWSIVGLGDFNGNGRTRSCGAMPTANWWSTG